MEREHEYTCFYIIRSIFINRETLNVLCNLLKQDNPIDIKDLLHKGAMLKMAVYNTYTFHLKDNRFNTNYTIVSVK